MEAINYPQKATKELNDVIGELSNFIEWEWTTTEEEKSKVKGTTIDLDFQKLVVNRFLQYSEYMFENDKRRKYFFDAIVNAFLNGFIPIKQDIIKE